MYFVHCAVLVVTTLPCDGNLAIVGNFAVCAGENVQLVLFLAGFDMADALVWCSSSSSSSSSVGGGGWHVCACWCWRRGRHSRSGLRNR